MRNQFEQHHPQELVPLSLEENREDRSPISFSHLSGTHSNYRCTFQVLFSISLVLNIIFATCLFHGNTPFSSRRASVTSYGKYYHAFEKVLL